MSLARVPLAKRSAKKNNGKQPSLCTPSPLLPSAYSNTKKTHPTSPPRPTHPRALPPPSSPDPSTPYPPPGPLSSREPRAGWGEGGGRTGKVGRCLLKGQLTPLAVARLGWSTRFCVHDQGWSTRGGRDGWGGQLWGNGYGGQVGGNGWAVNSPCSSPPPSSPAVRPPRGGNGRVGRLGWSTGGERLGWSIGGERLGWSTGGGRLAGGGTDNSGHGEIWHTAATARALPTVPSEVTAQTLGGALRTPLSSLQAVAVCLYFRNLDPR